MGQRLLVIVRLAADDVGADLTGWQSQIAPNLLGLLQNVAILSTLGVVDLKAIDTYNTRIR